MAGQAGLLLAQASLIPTWGDQLWDTSWLLRDDGIVGKALHALMGYSDRPMGVQLAAFAFVLVALIIVGRRIGSSAQPARQAR